MTHDKVTEHSETQQGTGPSPVPTVTAMAQRVSPQMKIDELIRYAFQFDFISTSDHCLQRGETKFVYILGPDYGV